jgi:hypothetical protein
MTEKFFDEQTEQSEVKAALVAKYFPADMGVIGNAQKRYGGDRIAYIDLFAGTRAHEMEAGCPLTGNMAFWISRVWVGCGKEDVMQTIALTKAAVDLLKLNMAGAQILVNDENREAYRELARAGLMEPLHTPLGHESAYRMTQEGVEFGRALVGT